MLVEPVTKNVKLTHIITNLIGTQFFPSDKIAAFCGHESNAQVIIIAKDGFLLIVEI